MNDTSSIKLGANSDSKMYKEGSLNVGCGTFGYKISEREELTELKELKQFCYKEDDFPSLAKAGVNKGRIKDLTF